MNFEEGQSPTDTKHAPSLQVPLQLASLLPIQKDAWDDSKQLPCLMHRLEGLAAALQLRAYVTPAKLYTTSSALQLVRSPSNTTPGNTSVASTIASCPDLTSSPTADDCVDIDMTHADDPTDAPVDVAAAEKDPQLGTGSPSAVAVVSSNLVGVSEGDEGNEVEEKESCRKVEIEVNEFLWSLTARSTHDHDSLERYEFLGDGLLKYMASVHLFTTMK